MIELLDQFVCLFLVVVVVVVAVVGYVGRGIT